MSLEQGIGASLCHTPAHPRCLPLVGGTVWATYTTLFTYRNRRSNQCFPRYQTLAEARGVSRRTAIRHVKTLIAFGLIEKAYRFYDDDNKRECGGQRSNRYWFTSFSPQDVTPGMSDMPPRTRSSPNQIDIKNLEEKKIEFEWKAILPSKEILLPTLPHWTKSLRDSLELTVLVMLCGMRWCDTLDRRREVTCRPHTIIA